MTIAACFVCPEGVVFGADSTTTIPGSESDFNLHYDFTQKLFEVGENGNLGVVTWGLGSFSEISYRTLIASFAQEMEGYPPLSVQESAHRWAQKIWPIYRDKYESIIEEFRRFSGRVTAGDQISPEENKIMARLHSNYSVGFCIGGICQRTLEPKAFEILISPDLGGTPDPTELISGYPRFWGWPNLMNRLRWGMDDPLFGRIMDSGKWTGTESELVEIVAIGEISPPGVLVPIRDAIDWVYSSIFTTIKGIKFSKWDHVCGGPIEIAVLTTDRKFRWVRHKGLDAAIT